MTPAVLRGSGRGVTSTVTTSRAHAASSAHRRASSKKPPLKNASTNGVASSPPKATARNTAGPRRAVVVLPLGTERTVDAPRATRVPVRAGSHPHECSSACAECARVRAGAAAATWVVVFGYEDRPAHRPGPLSRRDHVAVDAEQ